MNPKSPKEWIEDAAYETLGPEPKDRRDQVLVALRERFLPDVVRRFRTMKHLSVGTTANGAQVLWRVRMDGKRHEMRMQLRSIEISGLAEEAYEALFDLLFTGDRKKIADIEVNDILGQAVPGGRLWTGWCQTRKWMAGLLVQEVGAEALINLLDGLGAVEAKLNDRRQQIRRDEAFDHVRRSIREYLRRGGDPTKLLTQCEEIVAEDVVEA